MSVNKVPTIILIALTLMLVACKQEPVEETEVHKYEYGLPGADLQLILSEEELQIARPFELLLRLKIDSDKRYQWPEQIVFDNLIVIEEGKRYERLLDSGEMQIEQYYVLEASLPTDGHIPELTFKVDDKELISPKITLAYQALTESASTVTEMRDINEELLADHSGSRFSGELKIVIAICLFFTICAVVLIVYIGRKAHSVKAPMRVLKEKLSRMESSKDEPFMPELNACISDYLYWRFDLEFSRRTCAELEQELRENDYLNERYKQSIISFVKDLNLAKYKPNSDAMSQQLFCLKRFQQLINETLDGDLEVNI